MSNSQFQTQNNGPHNQKSSISNKSAGGLRRSGAPPNNGLHPGNAASLRKQPHPHVPASASQQSHQAHFGAAAGVNRIGNGQKQSASRQNNNQSQLQAQAQLNQQLVQLQSLNNQHHIYREAQQLQKQYNNDQNIADHQSLPSKAPIMQAPTTIINNNNINFYAATPGQLKQQIPFFSSNQEALFEMLQQNQAVSQPNMQVAKQQIRQNGQHLQKQEQRQRVSKPTSTRQSKGLLLPQPAGALRPMELQRRPEPAICHESSGDARRTNPTGVESQRSIRKHGIKVHMLNESYPVIAQEQQRSSTGVKQRPHAIAAQGLSNQIKLRQPPQRLSGLVEDASQDGQPLTESKQRITDPGHQMDHQHPGRQDDYAVGIDGKNKSYDPVAHPTTSQPQSRPSSIKKHLPAKAFQSDSKSFKFSVSETGQRSQAELKSLQELPLVSRASYKDSSFPITESQELKSNLDGHSSSQAAFREQETMYASVQAAKIGRNQFKQAPTASSEVNRAVGNNLRSGSSWKPSSKVERQALTGTSQDGGAYQGTVQQSFHSKRSLHSSSSLGVGNKTELDNKATGSSMYSVGQPGKKRRQIIVQKQISKQLLHQDGHKGYQQAEASKKRPKVQSQTYEIEQPSSIQQSSKFLGSVIASVGATSGWSPEKAGSMQKGAASSTYQEHNSSRISRQDALQARGQSHSSGKELAHRRHQHSIDERQNEIYGLNQNSKKPLLLNYPIKEMQRRGSHQGNRPLNRETMRGGNYQSAQEIYLPQTMESDIRQREQDQEHHPREKPRSLNPSPVHHQARRLVPLRQQEFEKLSGNASRGNLSEYQKAQRSRQSSARQILAEALPAEEYSGQPKSSAAPKHARRSSSRLDRQPKHVSLQFDSMLEADLEQEQQEFHAKQATARIAPAPSQDNFLGHDLESDHGEPPHDIEDLEQQILNMEYDPTGPDASHHHQIADIVADLDDSEEAAVNRQKNWKWLLESAQELEDDEDTEAIGMNKELEKTQRLSAIQQAIYQNH